MNNRKLVLKQLDRQLAAWLQSKKFFQPKRGWVVCLRTALGMTLPQLAKRLNVARSRVVKIQQAELSGHITLHKLDQTANALNCDFVYALVPRKPLKMVLQERAKEIAQRRLQRVSHSMALEDQAITKSQQQEQLAELINLLLSQSPKHLWEEEDEI